MTIAAYLDQEEDQEIEKIAELTPEAYKGLTTALSIDKAEQSILDEVTGVDGDEEESEQEELQQEEEMKSLFQSLYEIDPETNEPFVKGSAYDLKKWDDGMVCFAFGQPEHVVALEDFRCPGERYLQKMFDRVNTKEGMLSSFVRSHRPHLDSGLVNKDFAKGYAVVMGHPLQNVRMESFTSELTGTNYKIAMEEMTQQQMALAAGGAIIGVGLVYKMIQWFARALNKNTMATASIGQNFSAYFERKEMLRNVKPELAMSKETINDTVDKLMKDYQTRIPNIGDAPAKLKAALANDSPEVAFNILTSTEMKAKMKGKYTPFIKMLIEGKVAKDWWGNLNTLTKDAIDAQTTVGSAIEFILRGDRRIETDKPQPVDFKFLTTLEKLTTPLGLTTGPNGFIKYNPAQANADNLPGGNYEECVNSFISICDSQLLMNANGEAEFNEDLAKTNSLAEINVEPFNNFTDEYINKLIENAKHIEELAKKTHGEQEIKDKTDKVEVANKRNRVKLLVKEFKLISNLLRFVIRIRNQLGTLAYALGEISENALGVIRKFFRGIGSTVKAGTDAVTTAISDVKEGLAGGNKTK